MKTDEFNIQHKLLKHLDRLAVWYDGEMPDPIAAQLDPTNVCNNKCSYCMYSHVQRGGDRLTFDEMANILRQLRDIGVLAVNFSGGGEPLMNLDTNDALLYAKGLGLDIGLITNGQRITKEAAQAIVNSCSWCRISLSATTQESFIDVRGVDGFNAAQCGIQTLCREKVIAGSDVSIGVQWIYTGKDSVEDLEHFIGNFLRVLPVDYVQILPEQSYDEQKLRAQVNVFNIYTRIYSKFHPQPRIVQSKILDLELPNFGRNYVWCHGQNFYVMVGADMKCYVCCHKLGMEDFCIGDLRKQSLFDIWYGERRLEVLRRMSILDCLHICKHHESNKLLHLLRQEVKDVNFI